MLEFNINYGSRVVHFDVPDTATVADLKNMIAGELGIVPCQQDLQGWKKIPRSDSKQLSSLNLPQSNELCLVTPDYTDDGELLTDESDGSSKLAQTYILLITDETKKKQYNLKFLGSKTVLEVKTDVYTLTDIPVRHQVWTGWPSSLKNDRTTLACSGIQHPVHTLSVKKSSNIPQPQVFTKSFGLVDYSDDSDSTEETLTEEDILIDVETKRMVTLIPDNADDETEACLTFAEEFTNRYGICHPDFFPGSLEDAIKEACLKPARDRRLLALYLHHDGSVLTNVFCTQLLGFESILQCLMNNFVVWGWDLTHESNKKKFLTSLGRSLGGVAAMTLRNIPLESLPSLVIIMRMRSTTEIFTVVHGNVGVNELLTSLIQAVDVFTEQQKLEIREEDERAARELVKQQQDEAYRKSLEADSFVYTPDTLHKRSQVEVNEDPFSSDDEPILVVDEGGIALSPLYEHQVPPLNKVSSEMRKRKLQSLPNYRLTKSAISPSLCKSRHESTQIPPWPTRETEVLQFEALYLERLLGNYGYQTCVRKCNIYFYLEDRTVQVLQTVSSGIAQGILVGRQRFPYPVERHNKFYDILDFNIGKEIHVYDRVFNITNCDIKTKVYLNSNGIYVPNPIMSGMSNMRVKPPGFHLQYRGKCETAESSVCKTAESSVCETTKSSAVNVFCDNAEPFDSRLLPPWPIRATEKLVKTEGRRFLSPISEGVYSDIDVDPVLQEDLARLDISQRNSESSRSVRSDMPRFRSIFSPSTLSSTRSSSHRMDRYSMFSSVSSLKFSEGFGNQEECCSSVDRFSHVSDDSVHLNPAIYVENDDAEYIQFCEMISLHIKELKGKFPELLGHSAECLTESQRRLRELWQISRKELRKPVELSNMAGSENDEDKHGSVSMSSYFNSVNHVMPQETQKLPSEMDIDIEMLVNFKGSINNVTECSVSSPDIMIASNDSKKLFGPVPINVSSDIISVPSTSRSNETIRMLEFNINFGSRVVHFDVPDTATVADLKNMIAGEFCIAPFQQDLQGWKKIPRSDSEQLSSLNLPHSNELFLGIPDYSDDEDELVTDATNISSKLAQIYILLITDETKKKQYNLKFLGSKTVLEVKTDVYMLTDIPVRHQVWTGWPSSLKNDRTTLACSGIRHPVHTLSVKRAPSVPQPKDARKSFGYGDESDSSDDASETLTEEDIFIDVETKRTATLIPDNADDEAGACITFAEEFTNRYGICHPDFFPGCLEDAIKEACLKPARDRRLLALYLHHDGSVLTNVFCTQLLGFESILQCLMNNFVVWGWDLTHESNKQKLLTSLGRSLGGVAAMTIRNIPLERLPALVIIMRMRSTTEIFTVIHGNVGINELLTRLIQAVDVFTKQQKLEICEEDKRAARELVKQQQDEAYRKSLEADRAKEEAKRKQEIINTIEQQERDLKLQEEAQIKEAVRLEAESTLPDEPDEGAGDITRIRFYLPKGITLDRRFNVNSPLKNAINCVMPQETQTLPSEMDVDVEMIAEIKGTKNNVPKCSVSSPDIMIVSNNDSRKLFGPAPINVSSDIISVPSTSRSNETIRMLEFNINFGSRVVHFDVPDTSTVADLKNMIAGELGIVPCQQDLQGWKKIPRSDSKQLSSLNLPQSNELCLVTPDYTDDGELLTDESNGSSKLAQTYILLITDETKKKQYNLKFLGSKTVLEVKTDVYTLTDIPVRHQVWTGWPSSLKNDRTTLACSGIQHPVHTLSVKKSPNIPQPKDIKKKRHKKPMIQKRLCKILSDLNEADETTTVFGLTNILMANYEEISLISRKTVSLHVYKAINKLLKQNKVIKVNNAGGAQAIFVFKDTKLCKDLLSGRKPLDSILKYADKDRREWKRLF